jgi:DNA-binding transcriptional LysR family regulator
MEDFFAAHAFSPRIAMEMSSNETIKQAVMAGLGVSFLSLHTLGLELRSGLIARLDVEGTPVVKTWHLVHLLAKVLSPAAEAFRYAILENAQMHLRAHDAGLL